MSAPPFAATVLVINPGSTSTQTALFTRDQEVWREEQQHDPANLDQFAWEQLGFRFAAIAASLTRIPSGSLAAVVGRGGALKPVAGGTYEVNDAMLDDLQNARYGNHAANLGAILAQQVARRQAVPAFIVDPVTTDEFEPEARLSGVPEIERRCRSHALNIKAVGRQVAADLGLDPAAADFVVAHLGGGISVAALKGGRIVDVNDGLLGMGPFSAERAGALPIEGLLDLAYGGEYTCEKLKQKLSRASGFQGYLGTNDLLVVLDRVATGDEPAQLVYQTMVYQIAKEIGAQAAALGGKQDAVILTGGMARSEKLCDDIKTKVAFLGPTVVISGSLEMSALAQGVWRVLDGEEEARKYVWPDYIV